MFHLRLSFTFFILSLLVSSIILYVFDAKVKAVEAAGRRVTTTIASGQDAPRDIITRKLKGDDDPVVIWTDKSFGGGTVSMVSVNGGPSITLASGQENPGDVTTGNLKGDDGPFVFWDNHTFNEDTISMVSAFGGDAGIIDPGIGPSDKIAVGDFNGDGKLDIAMVSANEVSVLLGNGDGFPSIHTSTYSLDPFSHLVVSDFNGDGKLDIAMGSANGVSILLGNGDGTFQSPHTYSIGGSPFIEIDNTFDIAVSDFNRDGKLDITIDSPNGVCVLLGNGDGTFQPAKTIPLPVNTIPSALAVGDFWGNGKPSIAVGIQDYGSVSHGALLMLRGNGDGTFQSPVKEVIISNGFILDMAIADFKKNKKLGICWTESTGKVRELISNGDGTFQAPQTLALASEGVSVITVGNFGKTVFTGPKPPPEAPQSAFS